MPRNCRYRFVLCNVQVISIENIRTRRYTICSSISCNLVWCLKRRKYGGTEKHDHFCMDDLVLHSRSPNYEICSDQNSVLFNRFAIPSKFVVASGVKNAILITPYLLRVYSIPLLSLSLSLMVMLRTVAFRDFCILVIHIFRTKQP